MGGLKMDFTDLKNGTTKVVKDKFGRILLGPLNELVDESITDIVTTIGSFAIRSVLGKFQRSITFQIGTRYCDRWMEEALYGILYKYNDIQKSSNLEFANAYFEEDGSTLYYRLADGSHTLKYRNYDILLVVKTTVSLDARKANTRDYTIITYNLDPKFILDLERDMIINRNKFMKINTDSPTINVYQDGHEGDGSTYWEKGYPIHKRRIDSIYLPKDIKRLIFDTVNSFFASKEHYKRHGRAHNLKILLYGASGTGKDSIARCIASEYNRNIFYIKGGKGGRFIPNALESNETEVVSPLFIISDIDKYPFLINDTNVDLDNDETGKEDKMGYKQAFGAMINALDGITSGEDRIIIMTTNHIEKFSPVFLRPGRIDLLLEVPFVQPDVFRKYVYDFYNGSILPSDIKLKSNKLTIADLQFDQLFLKLTVSEFVKKHCE